MASIRDVAKRANVAACTVSRVLNGTANVSTETRQKIEQAMKELDYIPNELARSMFKQKAGIVAMLVPDIQHPYFSSLARYIEDDLYKHGYKLMLCSTGDDVEREKEYFKILKTNIVDGVIMGVNSQTPEAYQDFGKPLVMLDYYVNDDIPLIASDHEMGGKLAAEEFIRNGCKYVLHIGNKRSADRVISYKCHVSMEKILEEHNIRTRELDIKWSFFDFSNYLELACLILEKNPDIDGIMAADMPASAFLKAGVKLGKKIPEDLSVISYDGTYISTINIMEMTAVYQDLAEIGHKSVDMIIQLIEGKNPTEKYVKVPMKLKKGVTA